MFCSSVLPNLNRLVPYKMRFQRDSLSSDSDIALWVAYIKGQYTCRLLAFAP